MLALNKPSLEDWSASFAYLRVKMLTVESPSLSCY